MSAACSIPRCGKPVLNVRGWCNAHYLRWRRHGDPLGGGRKQGYAQNELQQAINQAVPEKCWLWPHGQCGTGYAQVTFRGRLRRANRVVCELVHGPAPTDKHQAAHLCGKRLCINHHHLAWKTRSENEADKLLHGTRLRGEKSATAKLTEAQVRDILRLRAEGLTMRILAGRFGVAPSTIQSIVERRNWRHLEEIGQ